ncbi:helix-turn-helix domain-containing protein [Salipiger pallidus]|nr:helix-turn-helix transcriptional regulator [Salipiger pallidus]
MLNAIKTADDLRADIASAAKARRLAMNITQDDLSKRSGVAIATLRRFEAGGPASLDTVLRVAEVLGVLSGFSGLFPMPEARTLDELEQAPTRVRASGRDRG